MTHTGSDRLQAGDPEASSLAKLEQGSSYTDACLAGGGREGGVGRLNGKGAVSAPKKDIRAWKAPGMSGCGAGWGGGTMERLEGGSCRSLDSVIDKYFN